MMPRRRRTDGVGNEWTDLADLLDLAGTDAAGADVHPNVTAVRAQCLDALKVRLGYFLGPVVRMAHLVAAERAFTANLTLTCHGVVLLNLKMIA